MRKPHTIFSPGEKPVLGMRSAVDPASLEPGIYAIVENLRATRRQVTTRNGCALLSTANPVSGNYRGHYWGQLRGSEVLIMAVRVSTATRIYSVNVSTWAFTELTGAATRFATDGAVEFAAYFEPGAESSLTPPLEFLIACNGSDLPAYVTGSSAGVMPEITLPDAGSYTSRPVPKGFFNVNDKDNTTYDASGANFTAADTGTSDTENESTFTIGTSAVANTDYGEIRAASGTCVNIGAVSQSSADSIDYSDSDQAWFIVYEAAGLSDPFFNYCDVRLYDGANYQTIYTPTGADRIDPVTVALGSNYYLVGFSLGATGVALTSLTTVSRWQFKLQRTVAANKTFKVAGILASGRVPYGALHRATYASSATRVEVGPVGFDLQRTASLNEYGVTKALIGTKLPENAALKYQYRLGYVQSLNFDASDYLWVYRKDPGEIEYSWAQYIQFLNTTGTAEFYTENVAPQSLNTNRTAPPAGTVGPPKARTVLGVNNRLYAGGISGNRSEMRVSQADFPLRFRAGPVPDGAGGVLLNGPAVNRFPGEDIYKLVAMPGSFVGVAPVMVMSDRACWRLEGIDAASLSSPTYMNPHGTVYPRTVKAHKGFIYYLDSEKQARRFSGGIEADPLSIWKIEDQFENGNVTAAASEVFKERYYISHRGPLDSLNKRAMVYEERLGEWFRDKYENQNWAAYVARRTSANVQLLGIMDDCSIYEVEKSGQTTDASDVISFTLNAGEMHMGYFELTNWGAVGMVVDESSGGLITVTRTDAMDSTRTATGTIDLDLNTPDRAWRTDRESSGGPPGLEAGSCHLSITGNALPGKYIKQIWMEIETRGGGPDTN